ncbi:MAG TPA: hypothetical protein VJO52_06615 [Gemmatimonadaceae bacterium]|nr:hypothetical protein [Gemmatimonadaceae bacterium]
MTDLETRRIRIRAVIEVRVGSTAALSVGARARHGDSRGEEGGLPQQSLSEARVRYAVQSVLGDDEALVDTVFAIVRHPHAYKFASHGDP